VQKDIFSATDTGLVRDVNEDSCGIAETLNGILCVVCDGMGGHAGGAEASRIAVDCIIRYFNNDYYPDAKQALKEALDFANLQILGTASEYPNLKGMGTTVCVLLIRNDEVWYAHAGDSRIYLYAAKDRQLHRLTRDHSYVQGLVDQGLISENETEAHPNKNRILKALGVTENLSPEIALKPALPAKGDIFLICSDGLSGMVPDKQIRETLSARISLEEKGDELMSLARDAGGTDNITLQLVRISNSPHRDSIFTSKNPVSKRTKQSFPYAQYLTPKYVATIAAVAILSFAGGLCTGTKNNVSQEIEDLKLQLNNVRDHRDELEAENESLRRERDQRMNENNTFIPDSLNRQ
jgi:serine/threonine protein phosphatase PrpC